MCSLGIVQRMLLSGRMEAEVGQAPQRVRWCPYISSRLDSGLEGSDKTQPRWVLWELCCRS